MHPRRPTSRQPPPVGGRSGALQRGETATRRGRPTLPAAVACLALLPIIATGCGDDGEAKGGSGQAAKDSVVVKVADFKFRPSAVKVRKGGTVTFANADKAPHTAQTDLDPGRARFNTGRLERGDRKPAKLDGAGRFRYFCVYHRFMEGTVEVVE